MTTPVHHLPPFTLGPYVLRVVARAKKSLPDQRRHTEVDWNEGILALREDLSLPQALHALLRVLVLTTHYRGGLNDASNEESYTHSLATGLVELASSSPQFWFELHHLLDLHFEHPELWSTAAGDAAHARPADRLPREIRMGRRVCRLHWLSEAQWVAPLAFGLYTPGENVIELRKALKGNNRALVVLHEVLHFLHDCWGLGDDTCEQVFCRRQARGLLEFWEQNPEFWAWWLYQVGAGARKSWAAGAR